MKTIISDYDGHVYTVIPVLVDAGSKIHYCGAYASVKSYDAKYNLWIPIDELTPKESALIAWDDLEAYVEKLDEEAQSK